MMKHCFFYLFILISLSRVSDAQAQLAKQPDLTFQQVIDFVNKTLKEEGANAPSKLNQQADLLLKSDSEEYINYGKQIYGFLENQSKIEEANGILLKKYPKGPFAANYHIDKLAEQYTDAPTLLKGYDHWRKKFRHSISKELKTQQYAAKKIVMKLVENQEFDLADSLAGSMDDKDRMNVQLNIAQEMYHHGKKEEASHMLNTIQTQFPDIQKNQSSYETIQFNLLNARLSFEKGDAERALAHIESVRQLYANKEDITLLYARILRLNDKRLDAFLVLENYLKNNPSTESFISFAKDLYTELNSYKSDWEIYLSEIKKNKLIESQKKWKEEMVNEPSIDFSLVDTAGKEISLSDYRGKTVILDFWATWCVPCKISFPGMQAAINKYKSDPNVVFLFIDTWERSADYKTNVKKYISDNKYTFHVLFDTMGEDAVVRKYGIEGIPTKIFIDPQGLIRFRSSGGSDDIEKIVNEMSYKIELIKSGSK